MKERLHPPLLPLGITKNFTCITPTPMTDKVYHALLLIHIRPEIKKILRKNQNGFRRNRSATSHIPTSSRII